MSFVQPCPIPAGAALHAYSIPGTYTDCYSVTIPGNITQAEFITAFYTTAVFKLERFLLATLASRPSTDSDAANLASGQSNHFAAWSVEHRSVSQLLLAAGPTRSWLMASPDVDRLASETTLYFGSAVVPTRTDHNGPATIAWPFHALLGFHKLYSRTLLCSAASKLRRT